MAALTGRMAVVTGGARGIGLAIAERLMRDGARVALWDSDIAAAQDAAARIGAHAEAADVTDAASLEAALARSEAALGPCDILVANAGITGPNHRLEDYPVDSWRRVIEVDLVGVFLSCRCVYRACGSAIAGASSISPASRGRRGTPMPPPIRRPRRA